MKTSPQITGKYSASSIQALDVTESLLPLLLKPPFGQGDLATVEYSHARVSSRHVEGSAEPQTTQEDLQGGE